MCIDGVLPKTFEILLTSTTLSTSKKKDSEVCTQLQSACGEGSAWQSAWWASERSQNSQKACCISRKVCCNSQKAFCIVGSEGFFIYPFFVGGGAPLRVVSDILECQKLFWSFWLVGLHSFLEKKNRNIFLHQVKYVFWFFLGGGPPHSAKKGWLRYFLDVFQRFASTLVGYELIWNRFMCKNKIRKNAFWLGPFCLSRTSTSP